MATTPESRTLTTLRVNPILCEAFGFCAEYAPELFALDEWGYAWPHQRDVPGAQEPLAEEAARLCPTRAIILAAGPTPPAERHIAERRR